MAKIITQIGISSTDNLVFTSNAKMTNIPKRNTKHIILPTG